MKEVEILNLTRECACLIDDDADQALQTLNIFLKAKEYGLIKEQEQARRYVLEFLDVIKANIDTASRSLDIVRKSLEE